MKVAWRSIVVVMVVDPSRHLFTTAEYERMGELGLFEPDERLELLAGEIIEMSPIGSPHADTVRRLARWFDRRVGDRAVVAVQDPLRLSDLSEPQPDVMLLRPLGNTYRARHPRPEDILLLIEVSDSTVGWDRRVKRPLYAAAGIVETWIVDLQASVVEIATQPTPSGYARIEQMAPGSVIAPSTFSDLELPVAELFD